MTTRRKTPIILVAEDDNDDFLMTEMACEHAGLAVDLHRVKNGERLLDYLLHRNDYTTPESAPRPDLILLDLNMPYMPGLDALDEIKTRPETRSIPVIILTVSSRREDIMQSYTLGASGYICKPKTMDEFTEILSVIWRYWFEVVLCPA